MHALCALQNERECLHVCCMSNVLSSSDYVQVLRAQSAAAPWSPNGSSNEQQLQWCCQRLVVGRGMQVAPALTCWLAWRKEPCVSSPSQKDGPRQPAGMAAAVQQAQLGAALTARCIKPASASPDRRMPVHAPHNTSQSYLEVDGVGDHGLELCILRHCLCDEALGLLLGPIIDGCSAAHCCHRRLQHTNTLH